MIEAPPPPAAAPERRRLVAALHKPTAEAPEDEAPGADDVLDLQGADCGDGRLALACAHAQAPAGGGKGRRCTLFGAASVLGGR